MNKIIFISGTHGSGKSTLAKTFIEDHGGKLQTVKINDSWVTIAQDGCAVLGDYHSACGGIDKYRDWKQIYTTVTELVKMSCPVILLEGVITYGKDKYLSLNQIEGYEFLFIKLSTEITQCIQNVLKRRAEKGNQKELNLSNIYRKESCWYSMYISMLEAGVTHCYNLPFDTARGCIDWFIRKEEA